MVNLNMWISSNMVDIVKSLIIHILPMNGIWEILKSHILIEQCFLFSKLFHILRRYYSDSLCFSLVSKSLVNWYQRSKVARVHNGEKVVSSICGVWKIGYLHTKEWNYSLILFLILCTKMNSRWINDLHVRPETRKLEWENVGEKLLNIDLGSDFLDMTPKHRQWKQK